MKAQNQTQGKPQAQEEEQPQKTAEVQRAPANETVGEIVVAAILGLFYFTLPVLFVWGYKALCFMARKAVVLCKWSKGHYTKSEPQPKVLPTPDVFKGMTNLAPARSINLKQMKLK